MSEKKEELIRCRDCAYFNNSGECMNEIWITSFDGGYPYVAGEGDGSGFCAWAEKISEVGR